MIRLEVAYTEHAGRFWRGTLTIDGEKAETFNWLHEVNDFIKKEGSTFEFPQGTDEVDIYDIQKKVSEQIGFLVIVHDAMDIS
tara:strand:+ start:2254 stop:2502 length:249 start_codon:yes stop_codon:yes gene_type:complete